MKKFLAFMCVCTLACVNPVEAKPSKHISQTLEVTVTHVADGDTFKALDKHGNSMTVRLLGIDCPESKHNQKCEKEGKKNPANDCEHQIPKGLKAKELAIKTLEKVKVTLEGDLKIDVYHRTLAYVRLDDGKDFNLELVKLNLCKDWSDKYPHPRSKEYKKYSK